MQSQRDRDTSGIQKKAVIDIDNTLWQFCDVLYERLKRIKEDFPSIDQWTNWVFFEEYCSLEEFLHVIRGIHLEQDSERHLPYPEAKGFLEKLKEKDFYIVIASHRHDESRDQTENWLSRHGLIYDELHLSFNKTELFDESCRVVVDDAPQVLERAHEKGALSAGLSFPWNRAYSQNEFRLFANLKEVLGYILGASI
jgi:5'(3')-deoxyribonucleotidase